MHRIRKFKIKHTPYSRGTLLIQKSVKDKLLFPNPSANCNKMLIYIQTCVQIILVINYKKVKILLFSLKNNKCQAQQIFI